MLLIDQISKLTPNQKQAFRKSYQNEEASRFLFSFTKYTFYSYRWENWHHELTAQIYQDAIEKRKRRVMIFEPPRHMKTEGLERALTFYMAKYPNSTVIFCAYGATRAERSSQNVNRNLKDFHQDRASIHQIFPNTQEFFQDRKASDTKAFWELGGKFAGAFRAAGVNGAITGDGFNFGVIDDPVKSREEAESPVYQDKTLDWYEGTFLNRQDASDSVIVLTSTRWNRKDLAGKLLEMEGIKSYNSHKPGEGCPEWNGQENGLWDVISLPAVLTEDSAKWKHPADPREVGEALWPQRFPLEHLAQFQRNKYNWSSTYQQVPTPRGGNAIDRAWFSISYNLPHPGNEKFIRFWDLAGTPKEAHKKNDPDFTAGVLVTQIFDEYYIIDVKAMRGTPGQVNKLIQRTARQDDRQYGSVKQVWEEEGGASGKIVSAQYSNLLKEHKRSPYRANKSKNFYIDLLADKAENGEIVLLNGPWMHEVHDGNTFLDELEEYPKGRHDDRIDAAAKALFVLGRNNRYHPPESGNTLAARQEMEVF